jgi:hypothetical protein
VLIGSTLTGSDVTLLPPIHVIWSGRYGSGRLIGGVPKWWGNNPVVDSYSGKNARIRTLFDGNTGIGAVTGIIGNNFALTRNHTFRYASGGKSAQQLTKLHFAHSMKVANFLGRVNIVAGMIGVGISLNNISVAYNTGNPINPWDVSDAAIGSVGVGAGLATFLVTNPVGWTVAAGLGFGVGVYFGYRLIRDLSVND